MRDVPTKHQTYEFPLDSVSLKFMQTGGYMDAEIIQLTRYRAYFRIDRVWWRFPGPLVVYQFEFCI